MCWWLISTVEPYLSSANTFSLEECKILCGKPFSKWQILDYSKLKEIADDNFILDENNSKFP